MSTTFWVTTNCNLNCKYCYEGEEKLNKVMSKEIIDKAIGFTLDNLNNTKKNLKVAIHGGEPFLVFDKMKYIVNEFKAKCSELDKTTTFLTTTNATILNDEIIDFIVNEMPDITVSIDGTKETHDKNRTFKNGCGSHDIAMENSLKLLKLLPNIRLRMTFDSDSVEDLYKDVKYLIDLGFKFIVPAPNLFDENWDIEHIKILESQIKCIKEYIGNRTDVNISLIDKTIYKIKGNCSGGKNGFHIYPNGKLYPCLLAGGNELFEIGDIFNGVDINKRNCILSHSKKLNPDCNGCKLYNLCDGPRCKIINKLVTDDYYSAPPMQCALENLKYKINLLQQ
ncbi:4Fe-4S cluster-binding domain-containing protein [Clostridioides mangenotii]|uniref:radical SAM/SPASM domain-containing protein n=1 Tax=Metaclostridioides mangenotii TaxID=1540 RepID=UPI002149D92D|nr:4Fe-4S cluster-binding domain-containing protein [Clostridioides mangenotii]MCR1954636.1 4Fe-4S cluster-binding domain-containing protein [Clostridioides mangenotii]